MKHLLLLLSLFIFMVDAKAQAPQLWAACGTGGTLNYGAILKSDSTGNSFQVVYSFDSLNMKPAGKLCEGGNGKLYGITHIGTYGGVCYAYDTSTGICTNFHNLGLSADSGNESYSGMMRAADGMLYGMNASGGLNSGGVIYRVDPSIDSYSPVYNFNYDTGNRPYGGLTQLSDGKLYGMTNTGGQIGAGVIFSFNPADGTYLDLHDFDTGGGGAPYFGSLLKGTDGKLYGLALDGGMNMYGVIFSYDATNNIYTVIHDFNGSDGASPFGSVLQANNGLLYGMTVFGGTSGAGVLFSFNLSTHDYSVLHNFNDTDGYWPQGNLIQASNGKLFGTTRYGGLSNGGTIFSFDIANDTFITMIDLSTFGCWGGSTFDILEIGAKPKTLSIPAQPSQNMQEFSTYPNPVTDHVTVIGKILTHETLVELWNDEGKRIVDFTMKGNILNVSMLPAGLYVLRITEGNESRVSKFVKQ